MAEVIGGGNHYQADKDGFLVGDKVSLSEFKGLWREIRDDIAAIRTLLSGGNVSVKTAKVPSGKSTGTTNGNAQNGSSGSKASPESSGKSTQGSSNVATPGTVVTPKTATETQKRPETGGTVSPKTATEKGVSARKTVTPGVTAGNSGVAIVDTEKKKGIATPRTRTNRGNSQEEGNSERQRDSKGRFIGKGQGGAGASFEDSTYQHRLVSGIGDRIDDAVDDIKDLSDVDPTIAAAQEIAAPLSRGWEIIAGKDDENVSWLKQIYIDFVDWCKGDRKFKKNSEDQLDDLIKKKNGDNRGGFSSFFGGGLGAGLTKFGTMFKLIGKKVPLLAAIFEGIGGIFDVFDSENSNLSRDEKNRNIGKAVGSTAGVFGGAIGGAKLGALAGSVFGPTGTAIGAAVGGAAGMFFGKDAGKILGDWCAQAFNGIKNFDFAGTWNACTETVKGYWNSAVSGIQTAWDKVSQTVQTKWQDICGLFQPVGDYLNEKWTAILDTLSPVVDNLKTKWETILSVFEPFTTWLKERWESIIGIFEPFTGWLKEKWEGIVEAFDTITAPFKKAGEVVSNIGGKAVDGVKNAISGSIDTAKEYGQKALDGVSNSVDAVKGWFGFGKKEEAKQVEQVQTETSTQKTGLFETLVNGAKEFGEQAKSSMKKVVDSISEKLPSSGFSTAQNNVTINNNTTNAGGGVSAGGGASASWSGELGSISKKYESGKAGAGTVSTGKGDYGGASYGTYQLSSKSGTLTKFLKSSPYGQAFAGLTPGTPEFNERWKQVAASDPNFGKAQHDFIKSTHYDPAMDLLKANGMDFSGRGRAVHEAVFSSSVQYGSKKAARLFQDALQGQDINSLSDAQIVELLQNRKAAGINSDFSKSSLDVRRGVLNRIQREKNDLLSMAALDTKLPAQASKNSEPVTVPTPPAPILPAANTPLAVSTPPPVVPASPAPAQVSAPPPVSTPLNTQKEGAVKVINADKDVSQDVIDRAIAHIVTGGYSGSD